MPPGPQEALSRWGSQHAGLRRRGVVWERTGRQLGRGTVGERRGRQAPERL